MAGAKIGLARGFARQYGAYVGLAALMAQLLLSFAHVHKHDLAFSRIDRSDVVSVGHAQSTRQAVGQLPSPLADDDDPCPICFSGFLLSNSSLPDVSANPLTMPFAEIDRAFNPVTNWMFWARHAAFRSRAPPAV